MGMISGTQDGGASWPRWTSCKHSLSKWQLPYITCKFRNLPSPTFSLTHQTVLQPK